MQIKVWCIPEGGLVDNLTGCMADLVGHSKKVSYIEWHPVAADILLSASADLQVTIALSYHTHTPNRLMALCPGLSQWLRVPKKRPTLSLAVTYIVAVSKRAIFGT